MCPEYYVDLLAYSAQHSIHWLVPYSVYKRTYDYRPKYACQDELHYVASDLADECRNVFGNNNELLVIQSGDFGNVFSDMFLRAGLRIASILDPSFFSFDSESTQQEFISRILYVTRHISNVVILDKDPIRQSQIVSLVNSAAGNFTNAFSLNEFLFRKYRRGQDTKRTQIVTVQRPGSATGSGAALRPARRSAITPAR
jgi:hypothetical protein